MSLASADLGSSGAPKIQKRGFAHSLYEASGLAKMPNPRFALFMGNEFIPVANAMVREDKQTSGHNHFHPLIMHSSIPKAGAKKGHFQWNPTKVNEIAEDFSAIIYGTRVMQLSFVEISEFFESAYDALVSGGRAVFAGATVLTRTPIDKMPPLLKEFGIISDSAHIGLAVDFDVAKNAKDAGFANVRLAHSASRRLSVEEWAKVLGVDGKDSMAVNTLSQLLVSMCTIDSDITNNTLRLEFDISVHNNQAMLSTTQSIIVAEKP